MTPISPFRAASRAIVLGLLAGTAPVLAQNTPSNTALPQTIPGLDNFSIAPTNRLHQPQITPTPSPTPSATPRATIQPNPTPIQPPITIPRALATPSGRPTPAPTRTPAPIRKPAAPQILPSPAPAPSATPTSVAAPAAVATPSPVPQATPTVTASPATPHKRPSPLWIVALIALLILPGAVVAAYFYRRALNATGGMSDADFDEDDEDEIGVAPTPKPLGPIPAPIRPATVVRAQLELAFRPRRAGTNVTSAAVDYELIVKNVGPAPARDIRVGLTMATAGNTHDTELKAFLDAPVERPVVAPFDLAPGESRGLKAMAMLPKDAVNVVTVKGRPMFVPMVAVNALYAWEGGAGQTATSHVIGIERGEGERMRPFWLDVTPRMHEGVSERPHALAVKR